MAESRGPIRDLFDGVRILMRDERMTVPGLINLYGGFAATVLALIVAGPSLMRDLLSGADLTIGQFHLKLQDPGLIGGATPIVALLIVAGYWLTCPILCFGPYRDHMRRRREN